MAVVTVSWMTKLAWTCLRCGAQFSMEGDPALGDDHNTSEAIRHEKVCQSDVRAGVSPGWLVYTVEPPVGSA